MAKKKFNLGDFIPEDKNVSNLGTAEISLIPWDRIRVNSENFYAVDDVEDLRNSIQMHGLLDPITVTPDAEDGYYLLISGHRRHKAWGLLRAEDPETYARIPAMIRRFESKHMAELALIMANSTARVLTPAEVGRQAERIERLLYELKEEGYTFNGRMRDQVAKACQVSASRIGRLKLIREKLAKCWMPRWEDGSLAEDTAYKLARLPSEFQERLAKVLRKPTSEQISNVAELYEKGERWVNEKGMKCPDGTLCQHFNSFLVHDAKCYSYNRCKGKKCCMKCEEATRNYSRCSSACARAKTAYDLDNAERAAKAERERQKEQNKLQKAMTASAARLTQALDAGDPVADDEQILDDWYCRLTAGEIRAIAAGTFKKWDKVCTSRDPLRPEELSASTVRKISNLSGVSTDYIMGLSDVMYPEAPEPAAETQQAAADPQQSPADAPEDDAIPLRPVARWHSGMKDLPIDRPLLTWQLTNEGEVYRTAIWTGDRFVDTKHAKKELTGLYFNRWMEIPEDGECCELPATGNMQFRPGQQPPAEKTLAWCAFVVSGVEMTTSAVWWPHLNKWCFEHSAAIDAECVGWYPLPDWRGVTHGEEAEDDEES